MTTLTSCQEKAKDSFMQFISDPTQSELVLSGYAGTGKSFLINYLLDVLPSQETILRSLGHTTMYSDSIYVTATTRKAAKVVADLLGCEPSTIHSLLGLKVKKNYTDGETYLASELSTISDSLIIIDEASYINADLLSCIRSSTRNCKVVYLGDPCQLLPPKSPNAPVFSDSTITTANLTTVMRNDGIIDEMSAQWRNVVLNTPVAELKVDHNNILWVNDDKVFQQLLIDEFTSPAFIHEQSAKFLAWTNKRVQEANDFVLSQRGHTNMFTADEPLLANEPIIKDSTIIVGTDQMVNIISHVETTYTSGQYSLPAYLVTLSGYQQIKVAKYANDRSELLKLISKARNWREYYRVKEELCDMRPAYASTVHKSQGSTYNKTFIDLTDISRCTNPNDFARMMYVAISRTKEQVIMFGQLPEKYQGVMNGDPSPN